MSTVTCRRGAPTAVATPQLLMAGDRPSVGADGKLGRTKERTKNTATYAVRPAIPRTIGRIAAAAMNEDASGSAPCCLGDSQAGEDPGSRGAGIESVSAQRSGGGEAEPMSLPPEGDDAGVRCGISQGWELALSSKSGERGVGEEAELANTDRTAGFDTDANSEGGCGDGIHGSGRPFDNGSVQLRLRDKSTLQLLQTMTTSLEAQGSLVNVLQPGMDSRTPAASASKESSGATDDASVESTIGAIHTDTSSSDWDGLIAKIIRLEFPEQHVPTARNVINVGWLQENRARYRPGSWVEIRGSDMNWRLDMITRVVKQAPNDWDWNDPQNAGKEPKWKFYYHAGLHRRLEEEELRSPEEGLRCVFGHRPWVWQQWACIKLEERLRFQLGHQDDCILMDVQKYVSQLWTSWLNRPENADFKAVFDDERVGDFGRSELVNHIMKPFQLMERIRNDKERWNFADDRSIGVFTYLGILGSGYLVPVVVMGIQTIVPFLLALAVDGCSLIPWKPFNACEEGAGYGAEEYRDSTYHIMAVVIFILYFVRVVPDTLVTFYNTLGAHSTAYSRLLSLRQLLWMQGDDTFGQMLGYKLDIYMNTAYTSALYLLNMYIILHTDLVLDMILNSLAFEFVARLDEELTKSLWWDPEQRWITAGALELVLQSTIQLNWLRDPKTFSDRFGIDKGELLAVCGGDSNLLQNATIASQDVENTRYMSKDEAMKFRFRQVAHHMKNRNAIDEYEAPVVYFGALHRVIRGLLRHSNCSTFNRFAAYRTWSRWEHVLYMSPVPKLSRLFGVDEDGNVELQKRLDSIAPPSATFANFDPIRQGASEHRIFLEHVIDLFCC